MLFPFPLYDQRSHPEKHIVDSYKDQFGTHKCNECINDTIPYKLIEKDVEGSPTGSTNYGYKVVLICRNNLVSLNENKW